MCCIIGLPQNLFIAMAGHPLLKPVWITNTVIQFSINISSRCQIPHTPSTADPTFDSRSVFTCVYSMFALPFDETHGTCCPLPFKEQSGAEQHAVSAIWIYSLILLRQLRCLSHDALSSVTVICSFSFIAFFLSLAQFSLSLCPSTRKHTQHVPAPPTVGILPSPTFPFFFFLSFNSNFLCQYL